MPLQRCSGVYVKSLAKPSRVGLIGLVTLGGSLGTGLLFNLAGSGSHSQVLARGLARRQGGAADLLHLSDGGFGVAGDGGGVDLNLAGNSVPAAVRTGPILIAGPAHGVLTRGGLVCSLVLANAAVGLAKLLDNAPLFISQFIAWAGRLGGRGMLVGVFGCGFRPSSRPSYGPQTRQVDRD